MCTLNQFLQYYDAFALPSSGWRESQMFDVLLLYTHDWKSVHKARDLLNTVKNVLDILSSGRSQSDNCIKNRQVLRCKIWHLINEQRIDKLKRPYNVFTLRQFEMEVRHIKTGVFLYTWQFKIQKKNNFLFSKVS